MRVRALVMMLVVLGLVVAARAQGPAGDEHVLKKVLVIEGVGGGGRTLLQTDAVEAMRVKGEWKTPAAGDEVTVGDGEKKKWEEREAGEDGWVRVRNGGYALWTVESAAEQVMVLEASGHAMAMVNGEPRMGDPYELGYVKLPVLLKAGVNEILMKSSRGRVRGKLVAPPAGAFLNMADLTMPDMVIGEGYPIGALVVVNAGKEALTGAEIFIQIDGGLGANTSVPTIPALGTRKIAVKLPLSTATEPGEVECRAVLMNRPNAPDGRDVEARFKLAVRRPTDKHKRTFISDIDGSVQYYSVVPPPAGTDLSQPKALILSLHGASVEATNQANCYKQRDWCYVVCPTNRRPYGFDWEDWGRLDALEVLEQARREFKLDDRRTYLTGHSMGGHGTWNIGVQFPGTFAALGPSAGWISFASYTGRGDRTGDSPVEQILKRAACTSDTLAMKQNLAQQGIYILHGDADDNVPVDQARTMRKELAEFHQDFAYYEQPGAGHWWGDQCVDWEPMIEFFKRHVRQEAKNVTKVEFTTVNPAVSAHCDWVTVVSQIKRFEPSRVQISVDREKRRFSAKTENVAEVHFRLSPGLEYGAPFSVEIDGQVLENLTWGLGSKMSEGNCVLVREGDQWTRRNRDWDPTPKLFKSAFSNRVVLVYGTKGNEEENVWALAKARYDAEAYWYRGNGDLRVLADTEYLAVRDTLAQPREFATNLGPLAYFNVILYGNADTNVAWSTVLPSKCPISMKRGSLSIGDRKSEGDDLACLFLFSMADDAAEVGVVGGTGLAGMRLTDRLPYFVSGVGVPDWVVMSPDLLTKGAAGIKGAGFFGNDWTVENGEAAWQE